MSVTLQVLVFCVAAAVSLATSYLLVTRLERIGPGRIYAHQRAYSLCLDHWPHQN